MLKMRLKDRKRFLELLVDQGYNTLGEFARDAGLGYHTVQQITTGKRDPTPRTALKIANTVNKDFHDIFEFQHEDNNLT